MELHQFKSCHNYFTIILQSSVGTLEPHSEVDQSKLVYIYFIKFRNPCKVLGL